MAFLAISLPNCRSRIAASPCSLFHIPSGAGACTRHPASHFDPARRWKNWLKEIPVQPTARAFDTAAGCLRRRAAVSAHQAPGRIGAAAHGPDPSSDALLGQYRGLSRKDASYRSKAERYSDTGRRRDPLLIKFPHRRHGHLTDAEDLL